MINAAAELQNLVQWSEGEVIAIEITVEHIKETCEIDVQIEFNGATDSYEDLFESLNFEYDPGYGIQHLYGTVWFTNGVWATRSEYDGSEGWKLNRYPELPDFIKTAK